jgi:hypothetical protein
MGAASPMSSQQVLDLKMSNRTKVLAGRMRDACGTQHV